MYGVVRVGAVDCHEDEEMCEEFSVYDSPTVMAFTASFSDDGEKYTGAWDWKKMASFATKKMADYVSVVTSSNYNTFMDREKDLPKAILFTDKKSTPAVFKELSKQYLGKLNIGIA